MQQIERQLQERNLSTALALSATWSLEHQERLSELIVQHFTRRSEPQPQPSH